MTSNEMVVPASVNEIDGHIAELRSLGSHPVGRPLDDNGSDPTRAARRATAIQPSAAAEMARGDAALEPTIGIAADLLEPRAVLPLDQRWPGPPRTEPDHLGAVAGMSRRASDRGAGAAGSQPIYDPYSARRRRTPEWLVNYTSALVVGDTLSGFTGATVAGLVPLASGVPLIWAIAAAGGWAAMLALLGALAERRLGTGPDEYRRVLVVGVLTVALLGIAGAVQTSIDVRALVLVGAPVATATTLVLRNLQRRRLHAARRSGYMAKRVVVVGREAALVDLTARLRRDASAGWDVVGACVPNPSSAGELVGQGVLVLGGLDHVPTVLDNVRADAVIVASASETAAAYLRKLSWRLEGTNIEVLVAPGLIEVAPDRLQIRPTLSAPLLQIREPEFRGLRRVVKSLLDRVSAAVALSLLSPFLLAIALAVKLDDRGPVFYRQHRVGRRGRTFGLMKFRSMSVDADARVDQLAEASDGNGVLFKMRIDPRVTRVGRRIRRWSLDELPQLVNVVRGEMSLVGPRPALDREVSAYGSDMRRRLLVKPGITGLWQVSGRSDLSWDESVELDVRYVENWSLGRDLGILWRTARAVLRGSGAY